MEMLYTYVDSKTDKNSSLIAEDVWEVIKNNADILDSTIIYDRDFGFDYFGFKTLEKSYLLKVEWPDRRTSSAFIHACFCRYPQRRHRQRNQNLQLDE
jgi:ribonucleotide reductase alpha subunit